MYKDAADRGFKYDKHLDAAILWHDFVYDDKPDKEKRSAEAFYSYAMQHHVMDSSLSSDAKLFTAYDVQKVCTAILATETHQITMENRVTTAAKLIHLDVAGLTVPENRLRQHVAHTDGERGNSTASATAQRPLA